MRSHGLLVFAIFAAANVALAFTCTGPLGMPAALLGSSSHASPSTPKQPLVIELFTSEGCSSCPPADSFLKKLVERQPFPNLEIIALEEHVDYWNHDGWFDPFSSPEFTGRQQDYSTRIPKAGVYTPQMIIDGRTELIGSRVQEALDDIRSAASQPLALLRLTPASDTNPHTRAYDLRTDPTSAPLNASRLDLWIAVTEKGLHSDVNAGENSGHTLEHAPVVRYLHKQQTISLPPTTPISFTLKLDKKWNATNLTAVAFLADPHTHQIQAAGSSTIMR
jgi:hypothetical protein